MKILYLTQLNINENTQSGIYYDLLTELKKQGCDVTVVTGDHTQEGVSENKGIKLIKVKTAKQFGVSFIKKGIAFLSMASKFKKAVNKNIKTEKFDLILYEAPPVMMYDVVKFCKKKFACRTYLMQKDIFPQNAVDIGILSKRGLKGIAYKYFLKKEAQLYDISDVIGCMSNGNIEYLKTHNSRVAGKCKLLPNAIYNLNNVCTQEEKKRLAEKYEIDLLKVNFVYGGNLGRPQGIEQLLLNIDECKAIDNARFYIIGKGTESEKVKQHCQESQNTVFFNHIPSEEYQMLLSIFDVGIIALDYRFTIPNYPSRVLSYMSASLPIIASTDSNTDFKNLIEDEAKCGLWNEARNTEGFVQNVVKLVENQEIRKTMGNSGNQFMQNSFNVENCAKIILDEIKLR